MCYQTKNVFGYPLDTPCDVDDDRPEWKWIHLPKLPISRLRKMMSGNCSEVPSRCYHHTPVYDDFKEWAQEVRAKSCQK